MYKNKKVHLVFRDAAVIWNKFSPPSQGFCWKSPVCRADSHDFFLKIIRRKILFSNNKWKLFVAWTFNIAKKLLNNLLWHSSVQLIFEHLHRYLLDAHFILQPAFDNLFGNSRYFPDGDTDWCNTGPKSSKPYVGKYFSTLFFPAYIYIVTFTSFVVHQNNKSLYFAKIFVWYILWNFQATKIRNKTKNMHLYINTRRNYRIGLQIVFVSFQCV